MFIALTLVVVTSTAWSADAAPVNADRRVTSGRAVTETLMSSSELRPFVIDLTNLAALTHAFAIDGGRVSRAEQHVEYGAAMLELANLQDELLAARRQVEAFNDELERHNQQLRALDAQKLESQQRITDLLAKERTTQADIESSTKQLNDLQVQRDQLAKEIAALERAKDFVASSSIRTRWNKLTRAQQAEYLIKYLQSEADPESYFPSEPE